MSLRVHLHISTHELFPNQSVELLTRWTLAAVSHCPLLQGFRSIPKDSHIWIRDTKQAGHGITYEDGVAKIYLRDRGYPAPGGDGRFPDGIDFVCYDWVEMLVSLVAHEGAHLRGVPGIQASTKLKKKMGIWATGERTGEQLAQVVSLAVLENFRVVRAILETQLQKVDYKVE